MMVLAQASSQAINLTAIIVALIGTAGAVLSFVQARQVRGEQRRMESRQAEAEAYERARKFDMETVESIRQEVARLQGLLTQEREANTELSKQVAALREIEHQLERFRRGLESERQVSQQLREYLNAMEERVRSMREHLSAYLAGTKDKDSLQAVVNNATTLLSDGPLKGTED